MYVPLVKIRIEAVKQEDHPGIEGTTRFASVPKYAVPLYRAKWGRKAVITVTELPDGEDVLWPVPLQPGMNASGSEALRLAGLFPKQFHQVYREGEFAEAFDKVATEDNPREVERQKRMDEAIETGSEIAARALMTVAGSNAATQARKRREREASAKPKAAQASAKPKTPSKVKPELDPVDA